MEWALIMTASTLTVLPLILVFLFTQRYFIRGVAMTGLKG
jgi:multiple sugar transport system permease protein